LRNLFKLEIAPNRIFGLDILRACAILFVLLGHGNPLIPAPLNQYLNVGVMDGVSIFFVLSGYLIGGILIKVLLRDGASWETLKSFWIRRWFRTLPNYFLILTVLALIFIAKNWNTDWSFIYQYYIFSQNLFSPHPEIFFPEAWSLSIEEWFYLTTPFILLGMIRVLKLSVRESVWITALSIIVIVTAFRCVRHTQISVTNFGLWDLNYRKQVGTRLDSLMFGVIGAYLMYFKKKLWLKYKLPLLILGVALFVCIRVVHLYGIHGYGVYINVFSFSLISLATLLTLPYLGSFKKRKRSCR